MTFSPLSPSAIQEAQQRIAPYVHRTPLVTSSLLNQWLGHEIIFKAENLQKIGAFKARGALNTLLSLKEASALPKQTVAVSSGNHAQGVAWASRMLGIPATIFLPKGTSPIKQAATRSYGATVVLAETRMEAEEGAKAMSKEEGVCFIPPYDHDMVIAGQGTACLEALQDGANPDAIFAPCGGGGLLSGTYLAAQLFPSVPKIYGGEPAIANDASLSYKQGQIVRLDQSPPTIADGVQTLSVSPRTFYYLQRLNGIIEVSEEAICYWSQWLMHLLKLVCEPATAVAMAACAEWLKNQSSPQKVLVILSGGNVAPSTLERIYATNYLETPPHA